MNPFLKKTAAVSHKLVAPGIHGRRGISDGLTKSSALVADVATAHQRRRWEQGISLLEVVITVVALGILVAIAVPVLTANTTKVENIKLQTDVAKLNQIISTYVSEGGSLNGITEPQAVLDKLKTTRSKADAQTYVGTMTGRGVDVRLSVRLQNSDEAQSSAPRAIWNSSTQRFDISNAVGQSGVAEFVLNDALATVNYGTEARSAANEPYNSSNGWVWASGANTATSAAPYTAPSTVTVTSSTPTTYKPGSPSTTSGLTASPVALPAPLISPNGGAFSMAAFPSSVSISANGAPGGTVSVLEYEITHADGSSSGLATYSGPIAITYGDTVAAENISLNTNLYLNSSLASQSYQVIASTLPTPVITPSGGSFTVANFPSSVTINSNGAPGGSYSSLQYQITHANGTSTGWTAYAGVVTITYGDVVSAENLSTNTRLYNTSASVSQTYSVTPTALPVPVITPAGGSFTVANYPSSVTISANNAPSGNYSQLQYEITHTDGTSTGWQVYTAAVKITYGDTVVAENFATNTMLYKTSDTTSQTYSVTPTTLPSPIINPAGGSFTAATFPSSATIRANGAPGGSYSTLQYQITHSNGSSTGWASYSGAITLYYGDTLAAQNVSANTTLYTSSNQTSQTYAVTATVLPTPTITPTGGAFQAANFPSSVTIGANGAPGGASSLLQYQITGTGGTAGAWTAYSGPIAILPGQTVAAQNVSTNAMLYTNSAATSQSYTEIANLPTPVITPAGGSFVVANFPSSVTISANGAPTDGSSTLQYQITHATGASTGWLPYAGAVSITYGDEVSAENLSNAASQYNTSAVASQTYAVTPTTLPTPIISPTGGSFEAAAFPSSVTISANGAPGGSYSTLQYQVTSASGVAGAWTTYSGTVNISPGQTVAAQNVSANTALYTTSAQVSQTYVQISTLPTPVITPGGGSFVAATFPSSITISANGAPGGNNSTLQYQITHANGTSTSWTAYTTAVSITYGDTVAAQNVSANASLYDTSGQTNQTYAVTPTTLPTPQIAPAGGSFQLASFPSSVTISANGAPGGSNSTLQYQISSGSGSTGSWTPYTGAFTISPGQTVAAQNISTNAQLYSNSGMASQTYLQVANLPTPVITPTGGSFTASNFPSSVTISANGAPGGSNSTLQYQVAHASGASTAWATYSGAVNITYGDTVSAQNLSTNASLYNTSAQAVQTYAVSPTTLPTPIITPAGGAFQQAAFPSSVTISSNGAPAGSGSTLQYNITHSNGNSTGWTTCTGAVSITYGDVVTAQNTSNNSMLYTTSAPASQTYSLINTLPTPVITPTGGSFTVANFPSSVTISSNGAPSGSSNALQYQVTHSNGSTTGWTTYTGAVSITYGDTVSAENLSNNTAQYNTSSVNTQNYKVTPTILPTPAITPAGGSFQQASFPSAVTISSNGAPGGSYSTLQYQITHANGASTTWATYTGAVSITYGDTVLAQNASNNTQLYTTSAQASQTYVEITTLPTPVITPAGGSFQQASFPSSVTISANGAPGGSGSTLQYQITHSGGTSTSWTAYTGSVSITYGDTVAAQNVSNNTSLYNNSAQTSQTYVEITTLPTPAITPAGGSFSQASFPSSVTISANGAPGGSSSTLQYQIAHAGGSTTSWTSYTGAVTITYGDTVTAQNVSNNASLYNTSGQASQTYVEITTLPTPVMTPAGGSFTAPNFPSSVTISSNGAPTDGSSTLQYQVTHSNGVATSWAAYSGAVSISYGDTVSARNTSNNTALYTGSGVNIQNYQVTVSALPTPVITPVGGSFQQASFPSSVTISANGAPGGAFSTVQYQIIHTNGSSTGWTTYSGAVSITYGDTVSAENLSSNVSLYSTSSSVSQIYTLITTLPTPTISPAGGTFVVATFPSSVTISANGAPGGSNRTLQYQITHSGGSSTGWLTYSSPVSIAYGDTVAAQNVSNNASLYNTSAQVAQSYAVKATTLPTPTLTPAGGTFAQASFPSSVTISANGAPSGSSTLQYNITHVGGGSTGWTTYSGAVTITYGDTVAAQNVTSNATLYTTSASASQTYNVSAIVLPTPVITPTGGSFTVANFPSSVTISANGAPGGSNSTLQYNVTHSTGVSTGWTTYSSAVSITYGDVVTAQNLSTYTVLYTTSGVATQTYAATPTVLPTPSITPTGGSFQPASFPAQATISANGAPGGTSSTLQYQVTNASGSVGAWTNYTGALTLSPGETLAAQNVSNTATLYSNSGVSSQTYVQISTLPTPVITPQGGTFTVANMPSSVTISSNGAPGGSNSTLQYMITHSNGASTAWTTYSSAVTITYGDTVTAQNLSNNASLYNTSSQATQTYAVTPTNLPAPSISPAGGNFAQANFPSSVTISSNGAAAGSSTVQYNITHASGTSTGWTTYSAAVSITYGDTVAAQNVTSNAALYTTSPSTSQTYNVTSVKLPTPVITPNGGSFVVASFPATASISSNGAPGGSSSTLQYNITHTGGTSTGWTNYSSAVAITYGDQVAARNLTNSLLYTTSDSANQTYNVTPSALPTPTFGTAGGSFVAGSFPSSTTISANGAPGGSYSTLQYQIKPASGATSAWTTYTGPVTLSAGCTITAQNVTNNTSLYNTSPQASQSYAQAATLPTPVINPAGGSFVVANFPSSVSISPNGAPGGGACTLQYNITHSNGTSTGWTTYSTALTITYGDTVVAQNLSNNTSLYTTSAQTSQTYAVTPTSLPTPTINPAAGSFTAANFPASVTVNSNGAPNGSSTLQYNIAHTNGTSTGWTTYSTAVAITYGDVVTARNNSSNTSLYTTSATASQTYNVTPTVLPTPTINPGGGTFTTTNFPSSVTINSNNAPASYSTLQYMITHSNGVSTAWATYSGAISITWGDTVMAQNLTSNTALYTTSASTSQTYTVSNLFVGTITPAWTNPTGGTNLSDTINNSSPSSIFFGYGNTALVMTGMDGNSNPSTSNTNYANITTSSGVESGYAGAFDVSYDGQTFNSYCVDVNSNINFNTSYSNFSVVSAASYFANSTIVTELGELITKYGSLLGSAVDDAAFQFAVWEIENETQGALNVSSGSFQVSGGNSASAISLANSWLSNLGTADNVAISVLQSPTAQSQMIWQSNTATTPTPITIPDSMTFNVNGINVPPNTQFTVGTLLIKNGTTANSSAATGVTLQLVLNLTAPVSGTYTANVKFAISAPDGGASSDTVTLSNPTTGLSIKVGTVSYAFNVSLATTDTLDGSISGNTLTIKKGSTLTAQLMGVFSH